MCTRARVHIPYTCPAPPQAAVFDLMTGQCDRHPNNVIVSNTTFALIDNDQSLGYGRECMYDSIFLPRSSVGVEGGWGVGSVLLTGRVG